MTRITKEELLEKIFNDDYENLVFMKIWDCILEFMRGKTTQENPLV